MRTVMMNKGRDERAEVMMNTHITISLHQLPGSGDDGKDDDDGDDKRK